VDSVKKACPDASRQGAYPAVSVFSYTWNSGYTKIGAEKDM